MMKATIISIFIESQWLVQTDILNNLSTFGITDDKSEGS